MDPGTQLSAVDRESVRQGSATILAPETGFMEGIFFHRPGPAVGMVWG